MWLGDFNMILNHDLDRFRPAPDAQTINSPDNTLALLMWDNYMFNAWRHLHPADYIYTCFSATHMSLSKIDHMLVSTDLIHYLVTASYISHSVSDHSPSVLEVSWGARPVSSGWHLNQFWLILFPEEHDMYIAISQYFTSNNTMVDPLVVWGAFKAFIRGYLTSAINVIKKTTTKAVEDLEAKAQAAEGEYLLNPNDNR